MTIPNPIRSMKTVRKTAVVGEWLSAFKNSPGPSRGPPSWPPSSAEALAAAAGRGRARIIDGEARPAQVLDPVDCGALELLGARGVDDDRDVPGAHDVVARLAVVEREAVLEPRAPAPLNKDTQGFPLGLGHLGREILHLVDLSLIQ